MAISWWDPLRDLLALQERFDRFNAGEAPGWLPPVDVYETANEFVITAEVPGVARDQIDIRIHDRHLILRGERPTSRVQCEQYHRVECGHGAFSRSFSLPESVDGDRISADLRDGVLTITLPKVPPPGPRRIEIE